MSAFLNAPSNSPRQVGGKIMATDWYIWIPDGRTLYCYGGSSPHFNDYNQALCTSWGPKVIAWPHPGNVVYASVSSSSALFVTDDNKVYGTESNQFGQLGFEAKTIETIGKSFHEIVIPTADRIVQIESSFASFVVTEAGDVYSCGSLCGRPFGNPLAPFWRMCLIDRTVFGNVPVKSVSAGCCVSTFLTEDGAVYVIGTTSNAEANGITGGVVASQSPAKLTCLWDEGVRVTMISSGRLHSIAVGTLVATGEQVVYGWGGNRGGALGEDFRKQQDILQPTLLCNVMAKLREGGTHDEVVHVSCGWYHSLLTTRSGRVLSLGAVALYGQLGRPAPTTDPLPDHLKVDCCQYMILDRPVREAYAGSFFSLMIPTDSSALQGLLSADSSEEQMLTNWVFGTCGIGGNGNLALYGDDLEMWNRYQCRMVTRFFSLREAIDSVTKVPPVEREVVMPGQRPTGKGQHGHKRSAANQRTSRYNEDEGNEDTSDDEEDGNEDGEQDADSRDLVYLSVSFSDTMCRGEALQHTFQSLPSRIVPELIKAWSLPDEVATGSVANLLSQVEDRLRARTAEVEADILAFAEDVRAKIDSGRAPRRLRAPQRQPPRYALMIAEHYNLVDLRDLVVLFSDTGNNVTDDQLVMRHVQHHLASLSFASTSLCVSSEEIASQFGAVLRNQRLFPKFTSFTLFRSSIYCRSGVEAVPADVEQEPSDELVGALLSALLHHSDHQRHCPDAPSESTLTTFEIHSMGMSARVMQAITQAVASHSSPSTSVGLRTLACNKIGIAEQDSNAWYAAVRDLIALNIPSLQHVHLVGHDATMTTAVAELLAPAVRQNTHLCQLLMSVNELGAEGVGLMGVQYLYEAMRCHISPKECVLYDIDVSGDDGQPDFNQHSYGGDEEGEKDRPPEINGRRLVKQWQALVRRNGQNFIRNLQEERARQIPQHPVLLPLRDLVSSLVQATEEQQQQKRKKKRGAFNIASAFVTASERKWVSYVASRPVNVSAEYWKEEFRYM